MSAGVQIEPTLGRLASASINQNLYCVANLLRDSGHLISQFLDEWKICELKNHQLVITVYIHTFWSHDSHRDWALKYLNFEPNVDVHFCLTKFAPLISTWVCFCLTPSPHSCGCLKMTPKDLKQWNVTYSYRWKHCLAWTGHNISFILHDIKITSNLPKLLHFTLKFWLTGII